MQANYIILFTFLNYIKHYKRGIGFSFKVENEIFRPIKIDIEKKLLNFA